MLTENQIEFLNEFCPNRWEENNGAITVDGNVDISCTGLTEIPVKFEHVDGYFDCRHNYLNTLQNCPISVTRFFDCDSNLLTTLKGGPKKIGEYYSCERNLLTNLIGIPKICASVWCQDNKLTSLEGCPRKIKSDLYCENNPDLNILYGLGSVNNIISYDNYTDLNDWIIEQSRYGILSKSKTIADWIKHENNLLFLRGAPLKIKRHFSKYILRLVEMNLF